MKNIKIPPSPPPSMKNLINAFRNEKKKSIKSNYYELIMAEWKNSNQLGHLFVIEPH